MMKYRWIVFLFIFGGIVSLTAQFPESDGIPLSGTRESPALEQYRFAEGMRKRQFYDLASLEYEKLISAYPTFEYAPEALFYWGECLRLNQQHERSVDIFKKLLSLHPHHVLAHKASITMITLFMEGGNVERAKEIAQSLTVNEQVEDKTQEIAFYYLGEIARKQKKMDEAILSFSKITQKGLDMGYPYRAYALLHLAFLYRNKGDTEKAEQYFQILSESKIVSPTIKEESLFQFAELAYNRADFATASQRYQRILKEYPTGDFAKKLRIHYARSLFSLEKYQAISTLINMDDPAKENDELLYIYGKSLKSLQQYEAALNIYSLIPVEASYYIHAFYDSSACLYALKKFAKCLEIIQDFQEKNQEYEQKSVFYYQANARFFLEKWHDAAEVYEKLLLLTNPSWDFLEETIVRLAMAYRHQKKFAKAASTYKRLLKFPRIENHPSYLLLTAECNILSADKDAAKENYEQLITMFPQDSLVPLALFYLGQVETDIGQQETESQEQRITYFHRAIEYFNRYTENYPDHSHVGKTLYLRGNIYYQLENYPKARVDLQASLDHGKEGKDQAILLLTYIFWKEKNIVSALDTFSQLLTADSNILKQDVTPDFLWEIGEKYMQKHHYSEAKKCFQILIGNSDKEVQLQGELGLGKIAFYQENDEKAVKSFYQTKEKSIEYPELRGILEAYLGETLRRLQRFDESLLIFQDAFQLLQDQSKEKALVSLGIATIHYDKKNYQESLPYATRAYVMYDDDKISPKAMLLAIKILLDQDNLKDANTTYNELKKRYPGMLASFKIKKENTPWLDKF